MTRLPLVLSLRGRILGIVVLGAILPLGLMGWWLSQSAAKSAEQRLRSQVDSSLVRLAAAMDTRWVYRDADLQLLTHNDVVVSMLARRDGPTTTDSSYLESVENEMHSTIAALAYRDVRGTTVWAFGTSDAVARDRSTAPTESFSEPGLIVTRPVVSADGNRIGEMSANIRLSALMPADSIPQTGTGLAVNIYDIATGQSIGDATRLDRTGRRISLRRRLKIAPIELELSTPTAAYLDPFERAAQLGLYALVAVAIFAVALSALLAARLTRSLEELVHGADGVARGDLSRSVEVTSGTTEIVQLTASFNAMTNSLRSTLTKLSQQESLAAVGEFAASLSHEVRNALTAVSVDLQRASEKVNEADRSSELLVRALRNVRRLDSIVTGALRMARSGYVPRERVNLLEVVRTATELAGPAMTGVAHTFIHDSTERADGVGVIGDKTALEQLFLNILVNSGQAISTAGEVHIDVSETKSSAIVTVADNGRGISVSDLSHLGEQFFSGKSQGSGLGVSIARRIASAHGGDLTISSTPGTGTTVVVTLPRDRAPAASCPPAAIAIS